MYVRADIKCMVHNYSFGQLVKITINLRIDTHSILNSVSKSKNRIWHKFNFLFCSKRKRKYTTATRCNKSHNEAHRSLIIKSYIFFLLQDTVSLTVWILDRYTELYTFFITYTSWSLGIKQNEKKKKLYPYV